MSTIMLQLYGLENRPFNPTLSSTTYFPLLHQNNPRTFHHHRPNPLCSSLKPTTHFFSIFPIIYQPSTCRGTKTNNNHPNPSPRTPLKIPLQAPHKSIPPTNPATPFMDSTNELSYMNPKGIFNAIDEVTKTQHFEVSFRDGARAMLVIPDLTLPHLVLG
ncbi:hypothetical protein Syun_022839 [Stephania yunnanensis]|uniref:Uncharacterized protein n=1 Tax=Stephania yunnanensis TaxID=152371 RepID=A0AAP0HYY3_9MAGN